MEATVPLYCDKVVFTLKTKNGLVLTNAYEKVLHLLDEEFGAFIGVQVDFGRDDGVDD